MKVSVEDEGEYRLPEGSNVSTIVEKLGHHLDSVIVLSDGEPIPLEEDLKDEMELKIISVVSGG